MTIYAQLKNLRIRTRLLACGLLFGSLFGSLLADDSKLSRHVDRDIANSPPESLIDAGLAGMSGDAPGDDGAHGKGAMTILADGAPADFTQDVATALAKIEVSGDLSLQLILDAGVNVEIVYRPGLVAQSRFVYDVPGTAPVLVIYFDNRMGIVFGRNLVNSPALLLAHELHHGVLWATGKAIVVNGRSADDSYIINQVDKPLAIKWNERIRRNHDGKPYAVECVVCTR